MILHNWRQYGPGDFPRFVTTQPLAGLGCDVDTLKRICRDDLEALDALDKALLTASPHGGDRRSDDFKGDIVTLETDPDTGDRGNTRAYSLRRLRSEQPGRAGVRLRCRSGWPATAGATGTKGYRSETFGCCKSGWPGKCSGWVRYTSV